MAFKGSHRSGQFLKYLLDRALEGNFDSLKERVIGSELFARPPPYDTGEDAIVRVTASDVRKRLLQHYGKYGAASRFRINLPQEVIHNMHPRPQEESSYVPTALGWATGKSFAIIAFIQNPDENGNVLLLAGADGEGTWAAGNLATEPSRLSPILQRCGIDPSGHLQHFELLLQLNTMAGSPNGVSVVACHVLPAVAAQ